jgi:hypothetical protein
MKNHVKWVFGRARIRLESKPPRDWASEGMVFEGTQAPLAF